ncbi:MAG: hypothetical protein HC804_02030 [Anaerolineae bacterium]|nr:hypothetical protein [Anaerolineae bacterium]
MSLPVFLQETEYSCTVACLRMVMAHFGVMVAKESDLYDCCQTSSIGTYADDVVACARRYGLNATHLRHCQASDLQSWLSTGLYPIALINTYPLMARWCMHAVIVSQIENDVVQFIDPARGQSQATAVTFLQAWQMNASRAIIVTL